MIPGDDGAFIALFIFRNTFCNRSRVLGSTFRVKHKARDLRSWFYA